LTVVCIWIGWNASIVHKRKQLLSEALYRDGSGDWQNGRLQHAFRNSMVLNVLRPSDVTPLSMTRRWLGDRHVGTMYVPEAQQSRAHELFPEAMIWGLRDWPEATSFREQLDRELQLLDQELQQIKAGNIDPMTDPLDREREILRARYNIFREKSVM